MFCPCRHMGERALFYIDDTMSKRDTDTELWNEDWFLELSGSEMLFYFYIKDKCDQAGFWRPNFKIFERDTGFRINQNSFLSKINADKERVKLLESGKWFLTGFIKFHFNGKLNLKNRFHKSVFESFRKNINSENTMCYDFEVFETSIRPQVEVNKEQGTENKEYIKDINSRKKEKEVQEEKKEEEISLPGHVPSMSQNVQERCPKWVQKTDEGYQEYLRLSEPEFDRLIADTEWIKFQRKYYPGYQIGKSVEQSWFNFWGTKAGWENKRKAYLKAAREARKAGVPCTYQPDWELTIQRTLKHNLVRNPFGKDPEKLDLEIEERSKSNADR